MKSVKRQIRDTQSRGFLNKLHDRLQDHEKIISNDVVSQVKGKLYDVENQMYNGIISYLSVELRYYFWLLDKSK